MTIGEGGGVKISEKPASAAPGCALLLWILLGLTWIPVCQWHAVVITRTMHGSDIYTRIFVRLLLSVGTEFLLVQTIAFQTNKISDWKSAILEEFRGRIEILRTPNLLCWKVPTFCPHVNYCNWLTVWLTGDVWVNAAFNISLFVLLFNKLNCVMLAFSKASTLIAKAMVTVPWPRPQCRGHGHSAVAKATVPWPWPQQWVPMPWPRHCGHGLGHSAVASAMSANAMAMATLPRPWRWPLCLGNECGGHGTVAMALALALIAEAKATALWPWPRHCGHGLGLGTHCRGQGHGTVAMATAMATALWPWPWPQCRGVPRPRPCASHNAKAEGRRWTRVFTVNFGAHCLSFCPSE